MNPKHNRPNAASFNFINFHKQKINTMIDEKSIWNGDERRLPENGLGRRPYDSTCILHEATIKEIDNVRKLFFWGFGLIVTISLAVGLLGVRAVDKLHDAVSTMQGDVKVIKYRIENHESRP